MFDPEGIKAVDEHTETFEAVAPDGEATPASEALWESWKAQGYALQELGVSPNAMCETTNGIATARAAVHERTGQASRR